MKYLEPKEVFKYFKKISDIPRCSLKEQQISDYLVSFAKKRNFEVYQDDVLNVIIKKNSTVGYENAPTVILQGHMDMVCEKNQGTIHDFTKDPIDLIIEGDFLKANGTTLGADNGIAVAFCLALLDSKDIPHPALEILITSQEEIGLIGANKLDGSKLNGKFLINIDAEDEGILFTSCAGGGRSIVDLPVKWEKSKIGCIPYSITLEGLKGGHSGIDIDKNRANANKLLGRILNSFAHNDFVSLTSINGGLKVNAIPREAQMTILIKENYINEIKKIVHDWDMILKNELKSSDSNVHVNILKSEKNIQKVFSKKTLKNIILLYTHLPYGVNTMSSDIKGLVESSSNLGIVSTCKDKITFSNSCRSSIKSLKDDLFFKIQSIAEITNSQVHIEGIYPEWEYKKDSILRDIFINTYKKLYKKEPMISALHAGLECGLLGKVLNDVDMISFGPDIIDVHTPDEKLSISSTKNSWEYLCEVLKEFKE
jgi:dipeptidase D